MREPPVVSVVVDNYNYAAYLADAIDSALAQTWRHTEVVVVDDGSTDGSRAVIERYGARVVAVLQDNGGQGSAFNAGAAACTGDVVIYLDSDDRLHPGAAALAVEVLAGNPDAAIAQFRLRVVDAELRPTGTVVPPAHVRLPAGDVSGAVTRWELPSGLGPGGAVAFPRATIDAVCPMPAAALQLGADTYLVRAAALLGPVAARDVAIADYRSHGRNDSNRSFLDVDYLHVALRRQVEVGRLLRDFAAARGLPEPIDPLDAPDPVLLSQRLASLRARPRDHPVRSDTRLCVMRAGVRTALRRKDIGVGARLVHAAWFVVVALAPRVVAVRVATMLLFPLSRPRLLSGVHRRPPSSGARLS